METSESEQRSISVNTLPPLPEIHFVVLSQLHLFHGSRMHPLWWWHTSVPRPLMTSSTPALVPVALNSAVMAFSTLIFEGEEHFGKPPSRARTSMPDEKE